MVPSRLSCGFLWRNQYSIFYEASRRQTWVTPSVKNPQSFILVTSNEVRPQSQTQPMAKTHRSLLGGARHDHLLYCCCGDHMGDFVYSPRPLTSETGHRPHSFR